MTKIILIGPACTGKSSIGLKISKKINLKFLDLDILLHELLKFPRKKIYTEKENYEKKKLELEIFETILKRENNFILTLNAGFLLNNNLEIEKKIYTLLEYEKNILLLFPFENIELSKKILKERQKNRLFEENYENLEKEFEIYKIYAKKIIFTEKLNIEKISQIILSNLKIN